MKRLATHIALLALAGALSAAAPALAAPPGGPGSPAGAGGAPNCSDPSMAKSPACMRGGKPGTHHRGPGSMGGNSMGGGAMGGNGPSTMHHQPPPPPGAKPPMPGPKGPPGPPPGPGMAPGMGRSHMGPGHNGPDHNGPGHMGPGHNGPPAGFQDFRRHFHFPHFAPPPFSVRPGFVIPHGYHRSLRPLPPEFFGYYPMYRGYLFFETPDGQIVIVSPRTFRIIAII